MSYQKNLKTYHRHHTEFSSVGGCLLHGMRVVIPEIYRPKVLLELHVSHPGVVQMKGIAKSRVWWPGIDRDIESAVASCEGCQGSRANPSMSHYTLGCGLQDLGIETMTPDL